MANPKPLVQSTGRRKASVARVRDYDGTGSMIINDKPIEQYFPTIAQRIRVLEPLQVAGAEGRYDIIAKVEGGGTTGQTDSMR
ncbi:MAG TPA: 30S ribosomal protein S9, partial [Actinobacteria bacterium]|nr:30S ribosomal protein S9 [Actinomycetota bacterium]